MTNPSSRVRRAVAGPRRGLTIVELIVAIMILSVGLLALASTSAYVATPLSAGAAQTIGSQVAQSRFDSLASVKCSDLAKTATVKATSTYRNIKEVWSVRDSSNIKIVVDSITLYGRKQPLVYESVFPCRDGI
jgi:prepilin-type N-terminal cleavage/methylation domain-containing protein